ncbi:M23 family metallopeptidase [Sporosarcina sp. SAFN-010]|uniref:M23 family metallopeptidase n=1 Tax=Sporosarcina sp. SAFN-010 TaxID=3387273 RepID=UPI003F822AA1
MSFILVFGLFGVIQTSSASAAQTFIKPINVNITSGFGYRVHPKDHVLKLHAGVDMPVVEGTSVKASAAGSVVKATYHSGWGNYIMIRHSIGGQTYDTIYAHLSSIGVAVGNTVSQGQIIGKSGNTGNSTGPHLHFELHKGGFLSNNNNAVDPKPYLEGKINPEVVHSYDGSWATLTIETADGSSNANLFGNPGYGLIGKVSNGSQYPVFKKALGSDGFYYYAIGSGYVHDIHSTVNPYRATVSHTTNVNVYDKPNGAYKDRVAPGAKYKVYGALEGWYDLGQNTWIKSEYVKVVK